MARYGDMAAPIYVPGRQVRCGGSDYAAEFHTRGWSVPDAEHTWIDGAEGELQFSIRRPRECYTLSAEILPAEPDQPHAVEIFFNCFRVGYFEFEQMAAIKAILPAELFMLRCATVVFHCRTAWRAKTTRRPRIAVRSWSLE